VPGIPKSGNVRCWDTTLRCSALRPGGITGEVSVKPDEGGAGGDEVNVEELEKAPREDTLKSRLGV
jgi:hypothetical protein